MAKLSAVLHSHLCLSTAIKAELSTPLVNSPSTGIVKFSCEFSSLSAEEESIDDIVHEYILSHLNTDQLCVYEGQLAWSLYIDCLVESSHGSLLDAIALAVSLSLKALALPKVLVHPPEEVGEKPRIAFDENSMQSLDASSLPLCVTLGISGSNAFVDPNGLEEKVVSRGDGLVCVFAKNGTVTGVRKIGDAGVAAELLKGVVSRGRDFLANK